MKKLLYLTFILLITNNLVAQWKSNTTESCGSAALYTKMLESNPSLLAKQTQFEETLKKHKVTSRSAATTYIIPVVVHVMHKGEVLGSGTNISDEQIFTKIKALNEEYRKIQGTQGDGAGVDLEIEFALAVRNPSGQATNGINRFDMTAYPNYMSNGVNSAKTGGIDDADLKELINWNPNLYYNIWLISEIDNNNGGSGLQGYATFAPMHGDAQDGAVILSNSFKDPNSTTEAHELGHAFNLFHTFEGDRSGSTSICPIGNGDYCADTPPHQREVNDCSAVGTNSCDGASSNLLFINNYMSYSYNSCRNMFTNDQKTRMITALTTIRKSFLASEGNNALVPVSAPISGFTPTTTKLILTGESIAFSDTSTEIPNNYLNGIPQSGNSFSWNVTNATTTLTSTAQNPTFTFAISGSYSVTHTATNTFGTNSKTTGNLLYVSNPTIAINTPPTSTNEINTGFTQYQVIFNEIQNRTDYYINKAYTDFSNSNKTIVTSGKTYPLSVSIKAGGSSGYTEYYATYIDFNNNGIFEDSERVASGNTLTMTNTTLTNDVIIPTTAIKNTLLSMRVVGSAGPAGGEGTALANAKINGGNFTIGDVEDYGIYIINAEITPTANFTVSANQINIGDNITFTDTSTNTPTSWAWKITMGAVTKFTSTLQNPNFTFAEAGLYSVELIATNGAGSNTKSVINMITVNTQLSNSDFETITLKSYPNPFENTLYVTNKFKIDQIKIYNIVGQLVLSKNLNTSEIAVDVSKLDEGIYIVSIFSDNKNTSIKMIKK